MPIKYRCHACGKKISITSRAAGKTLNCPKCGQKTHVPEMEMLHRSEKSYQPQRYLEEQAEETEFQLRQRNVEEDDLDLTPMVDVTFQLLIFFILTASLSLQKAIAVPPPDPQQKGAQSTPKSLDELQETSIIVEIQDDNSIIVDEELLPPDRPLSDLLNEIMQESDRRELVINAHADSFHETTVTVFDAANAVGMQKIRLVTRRADE